MGKGKQLYKTLVVNLCINTVLTKFYINLKYICYQ